MNTEKWKKQIEEERKQKDEFFRLSYQSPISLENRENFKGLDYYSPGIKYRFELELFEHSKRDTVEIEDTKGNVRKFIIWGKFRFNIDGVNCKLQTYKSSEGETSLFIPFRDLTSGRETYPAGRYIDLGQEKNLTPEGKWILDFNKAYNPWCAYSKNHACPFTPPENWLEVPIYAGEKDY